MRTLPVLATTGRVYGFLRDEFGTIVRLSWLPLLLVAVAGYVSSVLLGHYFEIPEESRNLKPVVNGLPGFALKNTVAAIIDLIGLAIAAVAWHRVILFGGRRPGAFLHLSFGKVEGLFVLFPVIVAAVFIALSLILVPVVGLLRQQFDVAAFALFLLLIPAILYPLVRTSLVLPLAVIKRRFAFRESWALTRGNFWRLVAVWLLAEVPLLILIFAFKRLAGPAPAILVEEGGASFTNLPSFFVIGAVLGFILSLIGGALGVAVLSYSYKALTGQGPDEILKPQTE